MILSHRTQAIEESMTLAITDKAAQLRAAGVPVISLSAGEPDMTTPDYICNAAIEAMRAGKTHYSASAGDPALKRAICDKLLRENGLKYEPSQIVVSNGAKHALHNAFQTILNPGDEVIIPSPCWVSYPEQVKLSEGVPVLVPTRQENDFVLDIEDVRAAITDKTKALVLCNPCNPTGTVVPEETVKALAELAVEHDFFIISDEIYEHLVYDDFKLVSPASFGKEAYEHTIVINGVSKAYAMTGWRIGYTACAPEVSKLIAKLQSQTTSGPNTIAQEASRAALNGPADTVESMRLEFNARRDALCERLGRVKGISFEIPHGAFYLFINVKDCLGRKYKGKTVESDLDFAGMLLEHEHVAIVPGVGFCTPGYIRLSFAIGMDLLMQAADGIARFVEELQD